MFQLGIQVLVKRSCLTIPHYETVIPLQILFLLDPDIYGVYYQRKVCTHVVPSLKCSSHQLHTPRIYPLFLVQLKSRAVCRSHSLCWTSHTHRGTWSVTSLLHPSISSLIRLQAPWTFIFPLSTEPRAMPISGAKMMEYMGNSREANVNRIVGRSFFSTKQSCMWR